MEAVKATKEYIFKSADSYSTKSPFGKQEVYQLVLQHLTGSDLLNLSEVSPRFNQMVANNGMEKIQLVIKEDWDHEIDAVLFRGSTRKYTSVHVKQLYRERDNVFNLICNFAEHLVSIDTVFDFNMAGILLPKLTSLKIKSDQGSYFENGLLSSVTALEKLQITGPVPFPYTEKVFDCIKMNPRLKELTLEDQSAKDVFGGLSHEPIVKQLNLKVLKINNAALEGYALDNLIMFIKAQNASLEELKLLKFPFRALFAVIGMPRLKRLSFSPSNSFYCPLNQFLSNIEEMNLILLSENQVQTLLSRTPNLKKLYIAVPTIKMVELLVYHTTELREFSFAYFQEGNVTAKNIRDWYENLKLSKRIGMNLNIEVINQI